MFRHQRLELLLFCACFLSFAYFNQGGGWNQNARFAEVRAMAEEGRFAIDNFLVYRPAEGLSDLVRIPVEKAEYTIGDQRFRLSWVDMEWNLYPVGDHPLADGVEKAPMVEMCASGDIGYVPQTGHFHPNKPPGTSFLALPGYLAIYWGERMLGISPDQWWTLNLNAWLATVCSVGLISALGCVLFFRLAREFSGGALVPALLATGAFAWGTTFFPFGTILFDHNLTAALLIASLYCVRKGSRHVAQVVPASALGRISGWAAAAGACAGLAAITNYIAAIAGLFLGLYALLGLPSPGRKADWRAAISFSLGVAPPFLLICWYGWVCFGSPFTLNTDFQNPLFKAPEGALFGMFALPDGYIAALLTFSPFRGFLWFSPVLLLAFWGLGIWLRERTHVAEARLCLGIFAFFFVVNASFNGYHAGFSAGPRYLVPGLPFLALGLVPAFARLPGVTSALALLSICIQLLLTATDAQNPVGVGGHARVEGRRNEWTYNLLGDYAWPLFASGRAWPLLDQQLAVHMEKEEDRIATSTDDPDEHSREVTALRKALREGIERGESSPFLLASVRGAVSVNPIGIQEGLFTYSFYSPGTFQTLWASFNLGEFMLPHSPWSLLPLLFVIGGMVWCAIVIARAEERNHAKPV